MNLSRSVPTRWIPATALLLILGLLMFAGCSKDSDSPTAPSAPTTTSMTGVMINGVENGRVNVTIATTTLAHAPGGGGSLLATVDASATYHPIGAGVVNMTGSYETVVDSISLSGGGYSVTTNVETDNDPPSTVGLYNGPNGAGLFGAVAVTGTTTPLCGTYMSGSTAEHGNLGVLINGPEVGGVTFSAVSSAFFPFEGVLSGGGASRVLTGVGGEGTDSLSITGTYNTLTATASGSWTLVDLNTMASESGTWAATQCP